MLLFAFSLNKTAVISFQVYNFTIVYVNIELLSICRPVNSIIFGTYCIYTVFLKWPMFLTQDVACAALQRVWRVGLTWFHRIKFPSFLKLTEYITRNSVSSIAQMQFQVKRIVIHRVKFCITFVIRGFSSLIIILIY